MNVKKDGGRAAVAALAGNPNVGKSTVFNALTGLNQHTGNWAGKTVATAQGRCESEKREYVMVDIPGAYSLMAHSAEEEAARNFVCFGGADVVAVVCDATCLERNLNLALQIMETGKRTVICINLMDEAKRKGIRVDTGALSKKLGIPVVGAVARNKSGLDALLCAMDEAIDGAPQPPPPIRYSDAVEEAVRAMEAALMHRQCAGLSRRWLALRLFDMDAGLKKELAERLGEGFFDDIEGELSAAKARLIARGVSHSALKDELASAAVNAAQELCRDVVVKRHAGQDALDRRLDSVLTGRRTAYPLMALLLALVFYITIVGANYPSALLAKWLFAVEDMMSGWMLSMGTPDWLRGALVLGAYRVLAWVVSVMLPPMAIFFPLFTLLEDAGYLPRVAYNLDKPLHCCHACGKQALTMCMGFGCNAAGVVGCRIIDSPRERLLAILTNNLVPCNGRFPMIIALIAMFFAGGGAWGGAGQALLLTAAIAVGVGATFALTWLLSKTLLKGEASSFTLELPPYRKPKIGQVLVRSMLDRTLFVLGRAAVVAAPAGLLIWLTANVEIAGASVLSHCAAFLDPFARCIGLDGVILIAFILGIPANEIVLPIIIMAYMAEGSLAEAASLEAMRGLLVENGWTWVTAVCTMLFSLMHWPCSTTLMTIKKETASLKWTALAFALPTALGLMACFIVAQLAGLLGLV